MMKRSLTLLIFLSLVIFSCKKDIDDSNFYKNVPLASELRLSSDTIMVGENTLALNTYVYRDFMPVAEEDGSPMISVCMLADIDSLFLLSQVSMKKQFVIHGDLVWSVDFERTTETSAYSMEGVSSGGPKWGPQINVDVVCEFSYNGKLYGRIIARDQKIHRTN